MTPKRRVPLGKRVRRAELEQAMQREARKAAKRGRAADRAAYNDRLMGGLDQKALAESMARVLAEPGARAMPAGAPGRWVPIGPSVVRRGQAMDRPQVSGRIRDIAVDNTGTRAYAGSAMGGVWYTDDGGSTWAPVGGWAERSRVVGGLVNAQAIGCLLVSFGAAVALDVVLAGTGEPSTPIPLSAAATGDAIGGVGVLAATNWPVAAGADPWEPDSGMPQLEGFATFRLLRSPAAAAGKSGAGGVADRDVVVACTSGGAFVGTRQPLPAGGGLPARDGYVWAAMPGMAPYGNAGVSDAVWLPGGRLVMAVIGTGLVYTDDIGTTVHNIVSAQPPAVTTTGVMSLAAVAPGRVYMLGETGVVPTLWVIPDATIAAPACAVVPPGLPPLLWPNQRDYDQAIAIDVVAGADRIYLGGSAFQPRAGSDYGASLWAYDVNAGALIPAVNVARTAAPPGGEGADQAGLIGNNVHGDVHAIRVTGTGVAPRQVWVATDGGVFVSDRAGRVHTFASMNTGMAALQPVFVRNHPVSGHMAIVGMQDNGTQVRSGDTVWDEVFEADGGGVAFHPLSTHRFVRQYNSADWSSLPIAGFVDPMNRNPGWSLGAAATGVEDGNSAFYSGVATVLVPASGPNPVHGRLALGTDRVWLTDDIGLGVGPNTWRTLPFPNGVATDGRAGPPPGNPNPAQLAFGRTGLGAVITMAWASTTELLVVYLQGIVRYTETAPGTWATKTWKLNDRRIAMPRNTIPTDICPIPGARNFYVTTTGVLASAEETVWFYSPSDDQFHRTGLRHMLDVPPPPAPPPAVAGPRDPAYAAVLDPADQNIVFIGTATGVWRGHRTSNLGVHDWAPFVNGLPQAAVQDLHAWVDPAAGAGSPRLLRAAVTSRGVWEVDLAADAKRTTWIRSNNDDNRRMPLAPVSDPLGIPPVAATPVDSSPDIVVRPKWPLATPPKFPGATMTMLLPNQYQLWTFQTAFRWLYPSIAATGTWTDALGNLLTRHSAAIGQPAAPKITAAVWNNVVGSVVGGVVTGGVRVRVDGTVTANAADPLAVYRDPWHTTRAPAARPSEIDFRELVVPIRSTPVWEVFGEPSTVDVLAHHRDGRTVPAGGAYAVVMWRSGATVAALMGLPGVDVATYLSSVATGPPGAEPAGWTVVKSGANPKWPVSVPLDGRMPRGTSIDVNLTGAGPFAIFLAFVSSNADDMPLLPFSMSAVANVPPNTVADLVTCWPYTAARVVHITAARP